MKSNWLFQLIKTLSRGEKRHFKLLSASYHKKGDSQYVRLFDYLAKAEKYEEKKLQKLFKGQALAVLKNQLFHRVLGSLTRRYEQESVYHEVQLLIQKSDILYQRKLFHATDQLLKRAAEKATSFELFETLITIYQRWKRLYIFVLGVENRAIHIQRFWEMEQRALSQLSNLREMEWASMQLFDYYYKHHYAKTTEERDHYHELIQHPLLQDIRQAQSFSAKVIYLNTLGLYNDCIGQKQSCVDCRAQLVQLYQEHAHFMKERATQYLAASNNWILGLIHLKAYNEAQLALEQILNFPTQLGRSLKGEEEVMWFRLYHSLRLEVLLRKGHFHDAEKTIVETSVEMERLGNKLNEVFKFPFYYFFAYTLFVMGKYEQALDWLEPLLHRDDLSFRSELFRFGRILHLTLHYELGNYSLLPSICRSAQRYLKKSGGLAPHEKLLLEFFSKAPHSNTKEAFAHLLSALQPLAAEPSAAAVLHHFDYETWARRLYPLM